MSKFGDYLKAQGASDEDAKLLDSPVAAKAFDKLQADLAATAAERDTIKGQYSTYQTQVTDWYAENDGKLKNMQTSVVAAKAEAERYRGALEAARDEGLIEVAENLLKPKGTPPPAAGAPPPDNTLYVSRDDFMKAADQLGDNLARLEDMVMEHRQLFPDIPLKVSDLRREALAARKTVPEYWESKYNVPATRESVAKAAREAEIAKWKLEGAKEKETELVSRGFNPETRPLVPSTNPFTRRNDPTGIRAKQPWDLPDGALSNDRVRRTTEHLVKEQFKN